MGQRNSSLNTLPIFVCSLFFALLFAPLVTAAGGGAVIEVSSIQLGQMETFEGSDLVVPFTIVEQSSIDADIGLNVLVLTLEGTEIHNVTTNYTITASNAVAINYTVPQMPYGFSNLFVTLTGDIAAEDANYVAGFNRTVQRLRPAQLSIAEVNVNPVDFNGDPTGEQNIRNGDYVLVSASVENIGDLVWSSNVSAVINGQDILESHLNNVTFAAASTTIVDFYSSSQFNESDSDISTHYNLSFALLDAPQQGIIFANQTFEVGPPPLARINLDLFHLNPEVEAGGQANWNLTLENSGEIAFNGSVTCTFSGGIIEYTGAVDLAIGANTSIQLSASARPGTLTCQSEGQRIWLDSVNPVISTLAMSAAAFEAAGSNIPAALGGPWHKGDSAIFSMLVRNHGDSEGIVQLRCEINGLVSLSEPVVLAIDTAGEVSLSIQMISTGQNLVNWSLISSNGAIDAGLEGNMTIPVSAQQSIAPKISDVIWDSQQGVSFSWQIDLDEGATREVQLKLGYELGGSELYPFDTIITLPSGMTSGQFVIGHVAAEKVVMRVNSVNWSMGSGPTSDTQTVPTERPEYSVVMNPLSTPRDPTFAVETSITLTISNIGSVNGHSGQIYLVDSSGNLLAQTTTDELASGEEREIILKIEWPAGSEVVLNAKWAIGQQIISSSQTYSSGVNSDEKAQSTEIPWLGIISGIAIAGAVVLLMRLKNSSAQKPSNNSQSKNKTTKSQKSTSKAKSIPSGTERKVQVGCPECARQLRVPSSYSGKVRCPDCSTRFDVTSRDEPSPQQQDEESDVEEVKQEAEKKEISCPDCEQSLRVPSDYAGSVRCPACKVVFKANS